MQCYFCDIRIELLPQHNSKSDFLSLYIKFIVPTMCKAWEESISVPRFLLHSHVLNPTRLNNQKYILRKSELKLFQIPKAMPVKSQLLYFKIQGEGVSLLYSDKNGLCVLGSKNQFQDVHEPLKIVCEILSEMHIVLV